MQRPVRASHLVLLAALAFAAPLGGCQGGLLGSDPRAMAMAALSEEAKNQVKGYLGDVDEVVALLGGVKDVSSALNTAPKLTPYVEKVQKGYSWISSQDAATLDHIRTAFGPELGKSADAFTAQLDRIADGTSFGSILKPVLGQVKLFR